MTDNETKLTALYQQMEALAKKLDELNPEETKVEDIDNMIALLEDVEAKCEYIRLAENNR
ncbi:SE1561 family protein [Salisediminibacterium halotolerans]|uniref:Uncharacterized protein n=1 Tax=Salisediminibacterium halotolerans TaxID=517425 RepID=A0A1H9UFM0_9BACI|nr:SE1561 family protein [Salisediminibacterium haloalkalitolerans]SES08162.1 hypothetical protein SAMN05444126_11422 [Salisediminibacterium haloalkalitolerans]